MALTATIVLSAFTSYSAGQEVTVVENAIAGETCDQYDYQLVKTPAPPQSAQRLRDFGSQLEKADRGASVVMIGDSNIRLWPNSLLNQLFPGEKIANFGISGDGTQMLLWRLDRTEMSQFQPAIVILMLGGSNLNVPACAISEGILAVVDKAKSLWPAATLIVSAITPRGDEWLYQDQRRREANASVQKALAERPNTIYVNEEDALACNMIGNIPWTDRVITFFTSGSPCKNYRDDLQHLTSDGYQVLSEAIQRRLSAEPLQN